MNYLSKFEPNIGKSTLNIKKLRCALTCVYGSERKISPTNSTDKHRRVTTLGAEADSIQTPVKRKFTKRYQPRAKKVSKFTTLRNKVSPHNTHTKKYFNPRREKNPVSLNFHRNCSTHEVMF